MINNTLTIDKFFDISIIHKTYKFYLKLYLLNQSLPKKDRYCLGVKAENLSLEILEKLFEANSKSGNSRLETLNKVDLKLKILQTIIRLCWEVKALDEKKYIQLQEILQEVGRMLGGWIKTTKQSTAR
jgi:hypothetical protein